MFCKPSVVHAFLQDETGVLEGAQTVVIHANPLRLVVQELAIAHVPTGRGNVREFRNMLSPGLGSDRRQKFLLSAVAVFNFPSDGAALFVALDSNTVSQWGEVGVPTHVDRILRASLDAGVALPAHIWLDVIGATVGRIDVHDVGRADVDAVSAPITPCHVDEGWHKSTP
ncbi:protein of unknown function [Candidatus Filomicrobium marinum]|uniref:Uncharacterized protein n=1 Tax=Candidatus Filomicrobium marinum TaxID=1608628 RepID=A0A0D6JGY7_9HYPH|nr:protein of unknown function [Candidatus Filomicrobium marinum]CPR20577.1 protein of unknown function [Candidatus Filomicrobium marinum]